MEAVGKMTEEHENMVVPHSVAIAKLESGLETAHNRIDALLSIGESIQKLVIDFTKLVSTVEQQGKDISKTLDIIIKHDERMDFLEDKMSSKDTVVRLHKRFDEVENEYSKLISTSNETYIGHLEKIETRLVALENKDKDETYEMVKSMKKWGFGAATFIVVTLLSLGLGLVWYALQNGKVGP